MQNGWTMSSYKTAIVMWMPKFQRTILCLMRTCNFGSVTVQPGPRKEQKNRRGSRTFSPKSEERRTAS
ncbi:hypothetical protein KOW79_017885 [Hemibagrus wyckioides]|uniref:Uncharacterized protein n=1 Tax=Hemibagrus wyckioides TaxID=337641 RepID=A0A9D3N9J4_9TELE|nr:hypothetical protein KOW79_017885 [Hemibagrus wyckioides]